MKVAILGAGALGTIFAAHLADAGHEVVVIAREPRASKLAAEGLRVTGLVDKHVRVRVATAPSAADDCELVVNALKTYQSPPVIAALRPRPGAVALSVQNGVLKNDELAAAFGAGGVLGATAMISGEVLADGAARFTMNQKLTVGELAGGPSERGGRIAAMFEQAGIRAGTADDIAAVEWSKFALIVPSMCLSMLTRRETWRFMSHPESAAIYAGISREMAAIARAEGATLLAHDGLSAAALARVSGDEAVQLVRAQGERMRANAPAHKVSALQDLERNRQTEVEELAGDALRRAQAHGLAVPLLETCCRLCRAISPTG